MTCPVCSDHPRFLLERRKVEKHWQYLRAEYAPQNRRKRYDVRSGSATAPEPLQHLEPCKDWLQLSELWGLQWWDLQCLWWLRQQPPQPELQQPLELTPQQKETGVGLFQDHFGGHLEAQHLGGELGRWLALLLVLLASWQEIDQPARE